MSFPFNISVLLILAISTGSGTVLHMLEKKSFHEKHVYQLYKTRVSRSTNCTRLG